MTDREQRIEEVLATVRSLVGVVKDSTIPHEEGDKAIGQLLAKLDYLMTQVDALTGDEPR